MYRRIPTRNVNCHSGGVWQDKPASRTATAAPRVCVSRVGGCWLVTSKHGAERSENPADSHCSTTPLPLLHVYISCTFYLLCVYVMYRSAC